MIWVKNQPGIPDGDDHWYPILDSSYFVADITVDHLWGSDSYYVSVWSPKEEKKMVECVTKWSAFALTSELLKVPKNT